MLKAIALMGVVRLVGHFAPSMPAAFVAVDSQVSKANASGELTAAKSFVSDQIDLAVYLIDGKYYEQKAVDDLVSSLQEQSAELSADAHDTLVPLINASYDARVENVDEYLDWYYSLPADYERLAKMITGEVDDFVAAGTIAAVGMDYALLSIDEMQNRESYKAEIVDAIEEERAEMLALVP